MAGLPRALGDMLAAKDARGRRAGSVLCIGPDPDRLSCRKPIAPWARRCRDCQGKVDAAGRARNGAGPHI